MHPYLSSQHFARQSEPKTTTDDINSAVDVDVDAFCSDDVRDNFVDLAASLSICCGVSPPNNSASEDDSSFLQNFVSNEHLEREVQLRRLRLASEIGGNTVKDDDDDNENSNNNVYERRHIVLILCDGMGNSILQNTLSGDPSSSSSSSDTSMSSFFMRNNQPSRLRAVFPSTTPAALTTLATAAWPGRHGMPGWNLRDKKGCDFPGSQDAAASQPVQLLVLSDHIRDARSGKHASEMGFESWDDVFLEVPWARKLSSEPEHLKSASEKTKRTQTNNRRRMIYVNAYNGDDYQNWSQGANNEDKRKQSDATDFSAWFIGDDNAQKDGTIPPRSHSTLFETATIEETAFETLGKPEGSMAAVEYFRQGINVALGSIAKAEKHGESTFVYLYTAHPDKHMHALGVEHEEVRKVVRGIEGEVERFWRVLGNRETLLSGDYDVDESNSYESSAVDAAVVVTADHGHITVYENDMVELPKNILDLLEYACIGVHGKGRHGYLHCRAGLQSQLQQRWQANSELSENFLLLTIEETIEHGLFGPGCMRLKVRPRLGDFVAVSLGRKTLVSPSEVERFKESSCQCQGAHGSLLPEEMSIPLILLLPDSH